jgi:undecaprenyl-diphosphatase
MNWLQALVLGIVEGVTEYLPVSSTGHLVLTQRLLGIPEGEAADAFAICIQAGAIAAVLGLYSHRVRSMMQGLAGRNPEGLRLLTNVSAAFLPAAVAGFLLEGRIKEYLFNLSAIAAAWVVGGVAILTVAGWRRLRKGAEGATLNELTLLGALFIGFAQCLAMWPGTSRSLVTILGALVVGLELAAAVEFSFLLGLVTLTAATGHDLLKHGDALVTSYSWLSLGVGFAAAGLSAWAAVRWMIAYLRSHSLAVFGWYRVALGSATVLLLATGRVVG